MFDGDTSRWMIRSGRPRESTAECAACSARADLGRDVRGVLRRDRLLLRAAALEHGAHVLAVDMLHRDEVLAVRARELVDARDVAVAQHARDLRLVDEHLDEVVVLGEVREHALDRDEVRLAVARRTSSRDRSPPSHRTRCDRAGGSGRAVEPFSPALQGTARREDLARATCPTRVRSRRDPLCYAPCRASLCSLSLSLVAACSKSGGNQDKDTGTASRHGRGRRRSPCPAGTTGWRRGPQVRRRGAPRRRRRLHAAARRGHARDRGAGRGQGRRRGDREDHGHARRPATTSTPSIPIKLTLDRARRRHAREGRAHRRRPRQGQGRRRRARRASSSRSRSRRPPTKAGSYTINGRFKFAVCDKRSVPPEEGSRSRSSVAAK